MTNSLKYTKESNDLNHINHRIVENKVVTNNFVGESESDNTTTSKGPLRFDTEPENVYLNIMDVIQLILF